MSGRPTPIQGLARRPARRPARRLALAALAAGLAALPGAAGAARAPTYPRYGAEVRASPYRPVLSTQADVEALRRVLWDAKDHSLVHHHPLVVGLELDYYPLNQFGLLGPYLQVGKWTQSAKGRKCVAGDVVVPCTPETVLQSVDGTDDASLDVYPVVLGAVYRYDLLRRRNNLPLVLHAKLGLAYYLYSGRLGESTASYRGHRAQGGVLGWQAAAGAALALDHLLERGAAPAYGTDPAASHVYLMAEYNLWGGSDLRGGHRLDFSDYLAGTLALVVDFN